MIAPRFCIPFVAALLATLSSCNPLGRPRIDADVRSRMDAAVASMDSLAAATRALGVTHQPRETDAIALGYLERLRLGLGSPFRLVDYALHDTRLPATMRRRVAWALLAHTHAGYGYRVEPVALDVIDAPAHGGGGEHLQLIERTVADASDPRAGELAVRLAYTLADAERTVGPRALPLSAQAAALLRDRELAQIDVRRLLHVTGQQDLDPLDQVPVWRAAGRFLVERPPLAVLPPQVESAALREVPRLLARLRARADRARHDELAAQGARVANADGGAPGPRPLSWRAALRLATAPAVLAVPPQPPVAVTVHAMSRELLASADARPERARRARFAARARNEETLAAEYALLGEDAHAASAAQTVLAAAVAMRPYAQETVWLPGTPGPTAREVEKRYGLRLISFDAGVPAAWRPYYLRVLGSSLADLERVLPALSLRGARVHFGESLLRDSALAMHDPATRTIHLPLATSAGTIAHEVAHDLDWQAARDLFARHGGYSTDRAVREQRGRLAASLRGLTAATMVTPGTRHHYRTSYAQRPAEIFARNVDWFVAAALARQGRSNGYLTAVQDRVLTGYASAAPPDPAGGAARALLDALDDMTIVHAATRSWYADHYAPSRTAYDLVRHVLETPAAPANATRALDRFPGTLLPPVTLGLTDPDAAADGCAPDAEQRAAERRNLVLLAAEARVRGALHDGALLGTAQPWRARLAHAGDVGPWRPELADAHVRDVRDALLAHVEARLAARGPMTAFARRGILATPLCAD